AEDAAIFNDDVVFTGSADNDIVLTGFSPETSSTIDAGAGADIILGGVGDDLITTGPGSDIIRPQGGNDVITDFNVFDESDSSHDMIDVSQFGVLSFNGAMTFVDPHDHTNATFHFAEGSSVTLEGVDYSDLSALNFIFKPAAHPLEGAVGNDTINGSSDAEVIAGYAGNDQIDGGGGDDTVYGGGGDDTIHGGAGNDLINGQDGSDHLFGDDGDDTLVGGDASDFSDDFFTG